MSGTLIAYSVILSLDWEIEEVLCNCYLFRNHIFIRQMVKCLIVDVGNRKNINMHGGG